MGDKEEPPRVGFARCSVSDGADSSLVWDRPASGAVRPPSSCRWAVGVLHSVAVCILKYTLWPFVYWSPLCGRLYIEVHSVAVCILRYILWPFEYWSTFCGRLYIEVHSVAVWILKYTLSPCLYWSTRNRRFSIEVHSVAVFMLKYTQ